MVVEGVLMEQGMRVYIGLRPLMIAVSDKEGTAAVASKRLEGGDFRPPQVGNDLKQRLRNRRPAPEHVQVGRRKALYASHTTQWT